MLWVGDLRPALCCAVFGVSLCLTASPVETPQDAYRTLGVTPASCKEEIQKAFERKIIAVNRSEKLSHSDKAKRRQKYIDAWETLTLDSRRFSYARAEARKKAKAEIETLVEDSVTSSSLEAQADVDSRGTELLASVGNQILALELLDEWLGEEDTFEKRDRLGAWLTLQEPSHPRFLQLVLQILSEAGEGEKEYLVDFIQPHFEEPAVFEQVVRWLLEDSPRGEFAAGLLARIQVFEGANAKHLLSLYTEERSPMMRERLAVIASECIEWPALARPYQTSLATTVWNIVRRELAVSDQAADPWLEVLSQIELPRGMVDQWIEWFKSDNEGYRYVARRVLTATFAHLPESAFIEVAISLNQDSAREFGVEFLSQFSPDRLSDRLRSVMPRLQNVLGYMHEFGSEPTKEAVDRVWKAIGGPDVVAVNR